jgi:hypothetical protein
VARGSLTVGLLKTVPFGLFTGLGYYAVAAPGDELVTLVAGLGMAATGRWAVRGLRDRDPARQLRRRAKENTGLLWNVAGEDRVAAAQMKRIAGVQRGILEGWELLPEQYRPLVDEDILAVLDEVEATARLARRRAALRRHLESMDGGKLHSRIEGLVRDLTGLGAGSPLRGFYESTLAERQGQVAVREDALRSIAEINAKIESVERLLSGLRGELLALDEGPEFSSPGAALARIKDQVACFRQGLDEVTRPSGTARGAVR